MLTCGCHSIPNPANSSPCSTDLSVTGRSVFMSVLCSWKALFKTNIKFLSKTAYCLGAWWLTPSSFIMYDFTASGHKYLWSVCVLYLEFMRYTHTSIFFGVVHSNRTVVVLLHTRRYSLFQIVGTFLPKHLALSLILWASSRIVHVVLWASLISCHLLTICSPFSGQLTTSNVSSVPVVFHWFFTWISLGQSWWINGTRKDFLSTRHSLLPPFFYFFCLIGICMLWRMCMCVCAYIYTYWDCIEIVYELLLVPNNNVSEIFLHKLGVVQLLTGYLSLGCQPGGDWSNTWHCTKHFTVFSNRK